MVSVALLPPLLICKSIILITTNTPMRYFNESRRGLSLEVIINHGGWPTLNYLVAYPQLLWGIVLEGINCDLSVATSNESPN